MAQNATISLHELPDAVKKLFQQIEVPPYLLAHLIVVHDVAARLVTGVRRNWPELNFDADAVRFGAAIHDIGKIRHPEELTSPGEAHRAAGVELLLEHGVPPHLARFARTHSAWRTEPEPQIEDFLVALADGVWKDSRDEELEDLLLRRLASAEELELWEAYMKLDELVTLLGEDAERRLLWQTQFLPEEMQKAVRDRWTSSVD